MDFRVIGPLPAYSFSAVAVRPFSHREVQEARELLRVDEEETSLADIKAAYYQLAQEHHPDLRPDDEEAEERFAHLAGAYQLLTGYCLGEAAAQGITAKKRAERYRCSLAREAVDKAILVTIKNSGAIMRGPQ